MITAYHRPQTLAEALGLLAHPNSLPLGGGTFINTPEFQNAHPGDLEVVDLQALGLDRLRKSGKDLEIEACVTLQQLLESPHTPQALKQAIQLEATLNIRNSASVAGALVACDGRSPFATVMLALDAKLTVEGAPMKDTPPSAVHGLGDLFALRGDLLAHKLITKISIPLNAGSAFETVARSPADRPIVCAAVAQWNAGRTRLALGGWGKAPLLAMDGTEADGLETAARSAFHEAADAWGSADYRMEAAATLAERCLEQITRNSHPG